MLYRLAHYEIVEEIGHGGMGVVYRARDTRLERPVAIKVLPSLLQGEADRRARFRREARAAAQLNHPNIATIYEVNEAALEPLSPIDPADAPEDALGDGGVGDATGDTAVQFRLHRAGLYIAMELVLGRDLHELLKDGPLPLRDAIDFAIQMASGLDVAHRHGVVHRDLKPRNIRVTPEGRVKILDFGLAKVIRGETIMAQHEAGLEALHTADGMIVGTVPYMAPEQVEGGEVDARSDLFSLGVVLYQMVTGTVPFPGASLVQFVQSLANTEPTPLTDRTPEASLELEAIVGRLLARDASERYATANMVLRDLKSLGSSEVTVLEVMPSAVGAPARPVPARRRWPVAVATTLAVLAILAGAAWFARRSPPEAHRPGGPSEVRIRSLPSADGGIRPLCLEIETLIQARLIDNPAFVLKEGSSEGREGDLEITTQCLAGANGEQVYVVAKEREDWVFWSERPIVGVGSGRALRDEIAFRTVRALAEFTRFRQRHPRLDAVSPQARALNRYAFGRRQLERFNHPRDLQQATLAFEEAVALDPSFADAHAGLASSLLRQYLDHGEDAVAERATAALAAAEERAPDSVFARVTRARWHRILGPVDEGIALLERLVAEAPSDTTEMAEAFVELAWSYHQANRPHQAEDAFRRAIALRPDHWRYRNDFGTFLLWAGQRADAREMLQAAVERTPPDVFWPIENLGVLELQDGNLDAALAQFEKIPSVLVSGSLASNIGNAYFLTGDLNAAERMYQKAAELSPENPVFRANFGDVQWLLGRKDAARASFQIAAEKTEAFIASRPQGSEVYKTYLVMVLAKAGSCDAALAQAPTRLATLPAATTRVDEQYFWLARAYSFCQRPDEALDSLALALEHGLARSSARQAIEFEGLRDLPRFTALVGQ